jgi:addiction module HigA family antidote
MRRDADLQRVGAGIHGRLAQINLALDHSRHAAANSSTSTSPNLIFVTMTKLLEEAVEVLRLLRIGAMTKKLPKRGLPPMHPGELLREEILPALDRPKTEIAKLLGVSRQTLYDILDEKQPVTPIMALRLGKLCGNGPELWLNLQKRYDLQRAEQELGEKIEAIPTLEVA